MRLMVILMLWRSKPLEWAPHEFGPNKVPSYEASLGHTPIDGLFFIDFDSYNI